MNGKPILNINRFSGSGEGGILYNEGFYPEVDNGKSVMGEGFATFNIANAATSGFTNIGYVMSILSLSTVASYTAIYQLYYNQAGKFFSHPNGGASILNGEIHSNGSAMTTFPDTLETANGNILYTADVKIGVGTRGKVISGSTTTLVSDKLFGILNRGSWAVGTAYILGDMATYTDGIRYTCIKANTGDIPSSVPTSWKPTTAVAVKVTNLKTGIEYTVTTVSKTTTYNDTLNFTAS